MKIYVRRFVPILVLLSVSLHAQVMENGRQTFGGEHSNLSPAERFDSAPPAPPTNEFSSSKDTKLVETMPLVRTPDRKKIGFDWQAAANQSFFALAVQHGVRMSQRKTRTEMDGAFFEDYRNAVSGLGGWGDSDSVFTNYVGHPMQGAITGFIQIQNDSRGIRQEFGWTPEYWKSRGRAMAWSALYSTQFELGPVSEASIGNVGKRRGTMGFVDLVMTPVGGIGLIVAEDVIDKRWIARLEAANIGREGKRRFYRMALNPQRTLANILRLKKPWHRDTRDISWEPADSHRPGNARFRNEIRSLTHWN
ncbi:MAG TPA: hypothetical protein VM009_06230 [Terriglobales bacterium]|nr:hypothetical protein [Terriglobales bacterium]